MPDNPVIHKADQHIAATYQRFPVVFTKGRGATLWDSEGRAYTDFVAGIAVCALGHAHPRIAQAVSEQMNRLVHVSNLYYTEPQTELAAWLTANSFADRVFFGNSGAEANEAAIKLARKYFKSKGETRRYEIIAMEQSFHGRTMATLSATGQAKIKKGFEPVLQGFHFAPFNDADALERMITDTTCAVLIEPVQGEGGVCCPDPKYLKAVRHLCDKTGTLLIFDEIQTGIGRTGKLFGYQHFGIEPDIMTLAKALANGLPMGAMLAREHIAEAFGYGAHASTFGGGPVIAAAALAVLKLIEEEKIVNRCAETSKYFVGHLEELKAKYDVVQQVRGLGLLLGLKLKVEGAPIVTACMENGFLINCVQNNILRFIPPLIIEKKEIDDLIRCLDKILADI
ncbi:acetylornithine transaminase [Desulfococcaceae bacterium HSG9]|nr:acetylornithine transaminase [Desulfococcaceae bacterium HSG9]